MFYYKVRMYDEEFACSRIFSNEKPVEKESVVVVPDSYGEPSTAVVAEKVEEYIALSSDFDVEPFICIVDMKAYKARMNAKNKRAMVIKKMQDKMGEVKLIETFKTYAEKDDGMRTLFKEYQSTLQEDTSFDEENGE